MWRGPIATQPYPGDALAGSLGPGSASTPISLAHASRPGTEGERFASEHRAAELEAQVKDARKELVETVRVFDHELHRLRDELDVAKARIAEYEASIGPHNHPLRRRSTMLENAVRRRVEAVTKRAHLSYVVQAFAGWVSACGKAMRPSAQTPRGKHVSDGVSNVLLPAKVRQLEALLKDATLRELELTKVLATKDEELLSLRKRLEQVETKRRDDERMRLAYESQHHKLLETQKEAEDAVQRYKELQREAENDMERARVKVVAAQADYMAELSSERARNRMERRDAEDRIDQFKDKCREQDQMLQALRSKVYESRADVSDDNLGGTVLRLFGRLVDLVFGSTKNFLDRMNVHQSARIPRHAFDRVVQELGLGSLSWEVWNLLEGRDGAVAPEDVLRLSDPVDDAPMKGASLRTAASASTLSRNPSRSQSRTNSAQSLGLSRQTSRSSAPRSRIPRPSPSPRSVRPQSMGSALQHVLHVAEPAPSPRQEPPPAFKAPPTVPPLEVLRDPAPLEERADRVSPHESPRKSPRSPRLGSPRGSPRPGSPGSPRRAVETLRRQIDIAERASHLGDPRELQGLYIRPVVLDHDFAPLPSASPLSNHPVEDTVLPEGWREEPTKLPENFGDENLAPPTAQEPRDRSRSPSPRGGQSPPRWSSLAMSPLPDDAPRGLAAAPALDRGQRAGTRASSPRGAPSVPMLALRRSLGGASPRLANTQSTRRSLGAAPLRSPDRTATSVAKAPASPALPVGASSTRAQPVSQAPSSQPAVALGRSPRGRSLQPPQVVPLMRR